MLFTTLTALLETAFNQWLKLDDEAIKRMSALQGKVIAIHVSNPGIQLHFVPGKENIGIFSEYGSPADVTLSGSALAFMRMSDAEDSAAGMLANGIQIDGDMQLAGQFSKILSEVDIDWEELLSHAVGDIVAHQAGQLARSGKGWLDDTAQAMRLNTSEYLQEESRLLPAEAELEYYLDAVDNLRGDTERMAARVERLTDKMDPAKSDAADNTKP